MSIGIFNSHESQINTFFENKFDSEIKVFNELLNVYASFLEAVSGKVKNTDFPNWTIEMLLSQSLPLMGNALKLLATGYLRSSEILVRVAGEAIILSIFFKEFPETEREYRTTDHWIFFRRHRIREMLEKVESVGTIFIRSEPNKKIHWNKIVFTNLYQESSRFLHNNADVIYDLMKLPNSENDNGKDFLTIGPNLYSDNILSTEFRRLFNTLLFSLVVLGVSLNIMPDAEEKQIMDKSSEIIEALGKSTK